MFENQNLDQLLSEIAGELEHMAHPLAAAAGNPFALNHLLHQIGWDFPHLVSAPATDLATSLGKVLSKVQRAMDILQTIDDFNQAAVEDGIRVGQLIVDAAKEVKATVDDVKTSVAPLLELGTIDSDHFQTLMTALASDMGQLLLIRYLAERMPTIFGVSRLMGLITPLRFPPLYTSPNPAPDAYPLRLPIRRLGLNTQGLKNMLRLPVAAVLDNLTADAFSSPEAFFVGVQGALTDMVTQTLDVLNVDQVTALKACVDVNGIELFAKGLIPRLSEADDYELVMPLPWTAGTASSLHLKVSADRTRLDWNQQTPSDLVIVEGVLKLLTSVSTLPTKYQPEISLELELNNPNDPSATLHMACGLQFIMSSTIKNDIGISLDLRGSRDTGFALKTSAASAEKVTLPLPIPGLDGLAFIVHHPEVSIELDHAGGSLSVQATISASGLAIDLPTVLFRKASRDQQTNTWRLEEGAPRINFSLQSQTVKKLLDLRIGEEIQEDGSPGPVGKVTQLRLIEPQNGDQLNVSSGPLFIGLDSPETGFIIEFDEFAWIFADGDSLLSGLSIPKATIHLPTSIEVLDTIEISNAVINRNGFSGAVSVLFDEQEPGENLFGMLPVQLYMVYLEFVENRPTAFVLKVAVKLPYFEEWVDLTIGLNDNYDVLFKLESTNPEGIVLTKEELIRLIFRSALIQYDNSAKVLTLALSGGIEPLLWNSDGLEWPRIDVTNLTIIQDLSATSLSTIDPPVLKFEEAWVDLKTMATLDLYGFHFELNRIGVGYVESTDKLWIDLTGSLRLIDALPMGVGVEGFRVTWPRRIYEDSGIVGRAPTADDLLKLASKIEVQFDGVYLFFGIPDTVEFEGFIAFVKEAQKVGFAGAMALRVPSTGLAIDAGLLVGMNFADPPYPFLYLQFGILLPVGIPLGQSGLALKGARGLFGINVTPDRTPEQNPYYDWYKRGPIEGAHPPNKWRDQIWSIAFGAGITITTTDGKLFGVQGLFALVIPGPVIFIEGKALVFDGLFPSDGPLKALGYFDGNAMTAQFNVEASLELVEGVIDVNAGLEAFFDFNNLTNWHLYLGKDQPMDRRVRAHILELPSVGWLFEANSYMMLDMIDSDTVQARLGAYIGFNPPSIDLKIAQVTLQAVLDGSGWVTLNPFQYNGRLALTAQLEVSAFGFRLVGIDAEASVAVEGSLPFVVDAMVRARVDLPIPNVEEVPVVGEWVSSVIGWFEENVTELPDIPDYIDVEVPFHWEYDGPPVLEPVVREVSVESRMAAGGTNAQPASNNEELWKAPVVPLDARPSIVFDQNMNQGGGLKFGGFSSGGVQRFYSGNLAFQPVLQKVSIWKLPLHKFNPAVSIENQTWELVSQANGTSQGKPMWGAFRPQLEEGNSGNAARRVLDLWTGNVFEFLTGTIPLALPANDSNNDQPAVSVVESLLKDAGMAWCSDQPVQEQCLDGKDFERAMGDKTGPVLVLRGSTIQQQVVIRGVAFTADSLQFLLPDGGEILKTTLRASAPPRQQVKLTLEFPEPVVSFTLSQPSNKFQRLEMVTRRPADAAFLGGGNGGPAIHLGKPCSRIVHSRVENIENNTHLVGNEWFDCVEVIAKDAVDVIKLCWVTVAEAEEAAARQVECSNNSDYGTHGSEPPMVFSTGCFFKVEVSSAVKLDADASDFATLALCVAIPKFRSAITPYGTGIGVQESATRYFRTDGPPQNLAPYIKWVSPQHQSAGHWHGADFVIRFNRPYIHLLYPDLDNTSIGGDFPYALEGVLKDAEGRTLRGFFHNWTTATSATVLPDEQVFLQAVENSPSPVQPPMPDDILEIRRFIDLTGEDMGAEDWSTVALGNSTGRPKWKRQPDGSVTVEKVGNEAGSLFLVGQDGWANMRWDCTIQLPGPTQGDLGFVLGYCSARDYSLLRIRYHPEYVIQMVRVQAGAETVLQEERPRQLPLPPRQPPGIVIPTIPPPLNVSISTRITPAGVDIVAIVGALKLVTHDKLPVSDSLKIGLFAVNADAAFSSIRISEQPQELTPGGRYTLLITGGEGGPTLLFDDFSAASLGDSWVANASSWTSGSGLRAQNAGASIRYRESLEDVELVTQLEMSTNDTLRLRLRVPDAARPPGIPTLYELQVVKKAAGCDVTATASSGPGVVAHIMAQGSSNTGSAARFPLRVRLIGDSLRVWVFEQQLINVRLKDFDVEPPAGGGGNRVRLPVAWSGWIEWVIVAGSPTIHAIDLRQAALFRVDFTASGFGSLTSLFAAYQSAEPPLAAGQDFAALSGVIKQVVQSQRTMANARIALWGQQTLFNVKRGSREALEDAKQQVTLSGANHDSALNALLLLFNTAFALPPTQPVLQRLVSQDGKLVGFLLHSPESVDPELLGIAASKPFGTSGRTRFQIRDFQGGTVPTGWIASSDGTKVIIYRRVGQATPNHQSGDAELAPAELNAGAYTLDIEYLRHHRDDQGTADHLYDRPYILWQSKRDPETVTGISL